MKLQDLLALGRLQSRGWGWGGGVKGQITAEGTGGAEQPRRGESFWYHVVLLLCSFSPAKQKCIAIPRSQTVLQDPNL